MSFPAEARPAHAWRSSTGSCGAFIARGVRASCGSPAANRWCAATSCSCSRPLSRHLDVGALDELTLTTNGSQLALCAPELAACGVRRINVSLDTLDPEKFRAITRCGDLAQVMAGIDAAQEAGLDVKINMVALKGVNEDEIVPMLAWAHGAGMDLTLIEVMPLGDDRGRTRSTNICR